VTRLLPEEHKSVAQYIYALCAVILDESKGYLIEGRLGHLVESTGCGSFGMLVQRAKSDPSRALEHRIVDAITTNETSFFRDTAPFDLLRQKIVPETIDRRKRSGSARLRIWSAACSTGQEILSIAITLKELLGNTEPYGIQLVGTDISNDAVARASRGLYNPTEISRGLTPELREKYFRKSGDGWQICDELRAMAAFRRLNLMDSFAGLGKFDVVFCRNVAIYFNDRDRLSLFQRMEHVLEPNGCLVIGAMESLTGICPQFESKRHMRAVFYQLKSSTPAGTFR
jgi:chemotaxis protein methyltransferase CheR